MNNRHKLLLYGIFGLGIASAALSLTLSSDYAKRERAYFNSYPHVEMALRRGQAGQVNHSIENDARTEDVQSIETETTHIRFSLLQEAYADHFYIIKKDDPPNPIPSTPDPSKNNVKNQPEKTPPPVYYIAKTLFAEKGYRAYEKGNYKSAIDFFTQAIKNDPLNPALKIQLAYAHKRLAQNAQAAYWFRQAIDHSPEKMSFALRREVEMLENHLDVNGYLFHRPAGNSDGSLVGNPFSQSQAGLEILYQPPQWTMLTQVYGRLLMGLDENNFMPDKDSFQLGAGLRLKPFKQHNLFVSLERLIALGDNSRSDWMMRMSYSHDKGSDNQNERKAWFSHSLYLDAAFIRPHKPDFYLTALEILGYNFKLSRGVIIKPHVMALATWQRDLFSSLKTIEAGPGLSLKFYFRETKYRAYRASMELMGQYRIKIAGNRRDGSGPAVTMLFHF